MQIDPVIFRAYDIRGITGHQLNEKTIYLIGQALGSLSIEQELSAIACGRDGRLTSPSLAQSLHAGIRSTGCNVIDLGLVPSPLVYFAAHVLNIQAAAVVTGSHNPPEYNGIKFMSRGCSLSPEEIQALQKRIEQTDFHTSRIPGTYSQYDICSEYLAKVKQTVQLKRPLKIVIDCGNGTAGIIAPDLYRQLGCEVITLYEEVDGHFPNHHPDPSIPENLTDLIEAVQYHQADLGLAFDGDSDRLGVITNQAENIWPDRQLMLYAIDILTRHPGATIVYDVKCSAHVKKVIEQHGGKAIMWKTGHSMIKAKLKETGALLAAEMSGHVFFQENWYGFDDAIYTGARLLEILARSNLTSSEIFSKIPDSINTPELKLPIAETHKFSFMEQLIAAADFPDGEICMTDGLRVDFKTGWALIRPSNTTACLVLRFEADDDKSFNLIKKRFATFLLQQNKNLDLPFHWKDT